MKNEIVICQAWWDGFFGYLPDLGVSEKEMNDEVDKVVAGLIEKGLLSKKNDDQLCFMDFLDQPASTEAARFQPLVKICAFLADRTVNNRTASSILVHEPNKYSVAETQGANFKVDGFLQLQQSAMPTAITGAIGDLAVPFEYKLHHKPEEVMKNRHQLLSNATFCMNDDPRRMHIYGVTIEGHVMAVWYFSRSHSAKSPDFDFLKDPRAYIRVMLALLFANEEELGFDQTVQHRLEEGKICFVYKVKDRYFKTQGVIFEHRSLCMTGRATRVWHAIEVESFSNFRPLEGATPVVLKDVWLNVGSKTEGQNLNQIFAELDKVACLLKKGDEPETFRKMDDATKDLLRQHFERQSWKQYFLTIACDWQGLESKNVMRKAQPLSTLFDSPPSTPTPSSNPYRDDSRSKSSHPANLLSHAPKQPPRHYCPKRQYRVVFEEVCEVLHDVQELRDVVIALRDCVLALQLMFVAGWVHRDVSSGNIYALRSKDPGSDSICVRGVLADLEYAKPFEPNDVQGSSDPKTGTAYFMAVEIHRQVPIYDPEQDPFESSVPEEAEPDGPTAFVIHNYQHDLESIFWILLWTLLARFPPPQRSSEKQKEFKADLCSMFQNTSICPRERELVFTMKGRLDQVLAAWLDNRLEAINIALKHLRDALKTNYITRRRNIGAISSYSKLHCLMRQELEGCLDKVAWADLPRLTLCSSEQDLAVAASSPVSSPTLAMKRERSLSDASGDSGDQTSKTARMLGATDVAASRSSPKPSSSRCKTRSQT